MEKKRRETEYSCAAAAENLLSRIEEEEWRRDSGSERGKFYGRSATDADRKEARRALNCVFGFADELQLDAIDLTEARDDLIGDFGFDGKQWENTQEKYHAVEAMKNDFDARIASAERNAGKAMKVLNETADRYGMPRPFDLKRGTRENAARLAEGYAFIGKSYERAIANSRKKERKEAPWANGERQRDARRSASFRGGLIVDRNASMTEEQRRLAGLGIREPGRMMDIHVVGRLPAGKYGGLELKNVMVGMLDAAKGKIGSASVLMYEDMTAPADENRIFYVHADEWNRAAGLKTPLVAGNVYDAGAVRDAGRDGRASFAGIGYETKNALARCGWDIGKSESERRAAIREAIRNGVSLGSIQQYFRIYMLNCRGDPEKCRRLESDLAFSKGIRQNGETVRDAKTDNVYSHRSH